MLGVCDGVHLLDEGQGRKGGVAMHHLVQNAAQAPNVRRPPNLRSKKCLDLVVGVDFMVCSRHLLDEPSMVE